MAEYNVRLNPRIKSLVTGYAKDEVEKRARLVLAEAKRTCPVDQGNLRDSLNYTIKYAAGLPYATVGSPLKYASYVHEGTGIYVGRGYIYPKRAKVLAWPNRNGSGMIFAAKVKGMKGRPWLRNALKAGNLKIRK